MKQKIISIECQVSEVDYTSKELEKYLQEGWVIKNFKPYFNINCDDESGKTNKIIQMFVLLEKEEQEKCDNTKSEDSLLVNNGGFLTTDYPCCYESQKSAIDINEVGYRADVLIGDLYTNEQGHNLINIKREIQGIKIPGKRDTHVFGYSNFDLYQKINITEEALQNLSEEERSLIFQEIHSTLSSNDYVKMLGNNIIYSERYQKPRLDELEINYVFVDNYAIDIEDSINFFWKCWNNFVSDYVDKQGLEFIKNLTPIWLLNKNANEGDMITAATNGIYIAFDIVFLEYLWQKAIYFIREDYLGWAWDEEGELYKQRFQEYFTLICLNILSFYTGDYQIKEFQANIKSKELCHFIYSGQINSQFYQQGTYRCRNRTKFKEYKPLNAREISSQIGGIILTDEDDLKDWQKVYKKYVFKDKIQSLMK